MVQVRKDVKETRALVKQCRVFIVVTGTVWYSNCRDSDRAAAAGPQRLEALPN
jgi:hypothetical protein